MYIAIFGYWVVGLPLAYVLGFTFDLGGPGIWIGLVVALSTVWVGLSWRFWRGSGPATMLGWSRGRYERAGA